jgi:flavin-binding protein dodecin
MITNPGCRALPCGTDGMRGHLFPRKLRCVAVGNLWKHAVGERKVKMMKNHVYKVLEIVGSSETSIEDAISTAVAQANKTVRNMDWFQVVETRGQIEDGRIGHYQVTLKIGFALER